MNSQKRAWVVATLDTKADEARYVCSLLDAAGVAVALADVSTSTRDSKADFPSAWLQVFPSEIAAHHPQGLDSVFTGDRGTAIAAMGTAFERFLKTRDDVGGVIGLGGSGGTALISQAMRALPMGVPKLLVSTMASGNVAPYVGA